MTQLLPPNATPLERNASAVMASIGEVPVPIASLAQPGACPAPLLPWFAWQMSVDAWGDSWTEEQRRAVIASSFQVHRQKGTGSSVRSAIQSLGLSAEIYEWFQETPKAAPFTFRVEVDDVGVTPDMLDSLHKQVTENKPVRTRFTMQLIARPKAQMYFGTAVQCLETTTIYPKP